ncbi:hypothetical protein HNV08_14290 [Winogradskyella eckloniae]|uniref:DUF6090 family protein n=1 Tax=Winogradskyella eckloniae TaxID=1089306 RepID=UPI001564ED63|nr:DUF6090 family protein [Winogradskyella eckloniae]NRD21224.1 hypothetical protein [Winogradskyella eckloniae]
MIKFFRKIRQKLLTENKLSKYLVYAIGEVILVVIGILIALQLNNHNDTKKNKGYEKDYLDRIQLDIKQDIAELEQLFKGDTIQLDAYTYLGRYLLSDSKVTDSISLVTKSSKVFGIHWFEGKNIVFDDMKSSGKTGLITSGSLRNSIQYYYRLFDEVIKEESVHNNSILKYNNTIYPFFETGAGADLGMPERWKENAIEKSYNKYYNSLINLDEDQKKIISDNFGLAKANILLNHKVRLLLHKEGLKTIKAIDAYLKQEK